MAAVAGTAAGMYGGSYDPYQPSAAPGGYSQPAFDMATAVQYAGGYSYASQAPTSNGFGGQTGYTYGGQMPPSSSFAASQPNNAYGSSQTQAYGSQTPAYGGAYDGAYASQSPAYGGAYGSQPPAYASQPPAYGSSTPPYGGAYSQTGAQSYGAGSYTAAPQASSFTAYAPPAEQRNYQQGYGAYSNYGAPGPSSGSFVGASYPAPSSGSFAAPLGGSAYYGGATAYGGAPSYVPAPAYPGYSQTASFVPPPAPGGGSFTLNQPLPASSSFVPPPMGTGSYAGAGMPQFQFYPEPQALGMKDNSARTRPAEGLVSAAPGRPAAAGTQPGAAPAGALRPPLAPGSARPTGAHPSSQRPPVRAHSVTKKKKKTCCGLC